MVATMILNNEVDGIEITFSEKPAQNILNALKSHGFRWHNKKKIWYAKNTPEHLEVAQAITDGKEVEAESEKRTLKTKEQKNVFGVKVGDIFSASWGYEQTNNDFFQVIALVGEKSVRVREVNPPIVSREAVSGMSEDRVYKLTGELLPPAPYSVFIKDQENGDLKRLKPGYFQDKEKAKENCFFAISSYADATKCNNEYEKVYESWYY